MTLVGLKDHPGGTKRTPEKGPKTRVFGQKVGFWRPWDPKNDPKRPSPEAPGGLKRPKTTFFGGPEGGFGASNIGAGIRKIKFR